MSEQQAPAANPIHLWAWYELSPELAAEKNATHLAVCQGCGTTKYETKKEANA